MSAPKIQFDRGHATLLFFIVLLLLSNLLTLGAWQREQQSGPETPVFPSTRGGPLGRDGVASLLAQYVATAQQHCPS